MKYLSIPAMILILFAVLPACKSDDTTAPIIELAGNNPDVVIYKSAATYTEPGATAMDDTDGETTVEFFGTVNMNSAGEYQLAYTATDQAGNKATVHRTVIVDAAPYIIGNYSVLDVCSGVSSPLYTDSVSRIPATNNEIRFTMFGYLANAGVRATIAGSTITIPQQIIYCGSPTTARAFSGQGIFSDTSILINYTRITGMTPDTGTGTYERL